MANDIVNDNLCMLVKSVCSLSNEDTYEENIDHLVKFFKENPGMITSFLSFNTYEQIFNSINNQPLPEDDGYKWLNEDFMVARFLDIFDIETKQVKDKWIDVFKQEFENDAVIHYVFMTTVIKSMVDFYGYIDFENLQRLAIKADPKDEEFLKDINFIKKLCKDSKVISVHCITLDDDHIARIEIIDNIEEFLKQRELYADVFDYEEEELSYYVGMSDNYMRNIATFNSVDTEFAKYMHEGRKLCSQIYVGMDGLPESFIRELDKFNEHYPKWVLKGHTVEDFEEYFGS